MSQQKSSEKEKPVFATRLRLRLSRLGMQSNEVAEKLGVSESSISNWLSGVNSAKGINLRKLAELLTVPVPWLIGDTDTEQLEDEFRTSYMFREGKMDTRDELSYWRHRARDSEKKLVELQSILRSCLELSGVGGTPEPPGAKKSSIAGRIVAKASEEFRRK
jgi:transcriptional regulator with XRE-family HTH domain